MTENTYAHKVHCVPRYNNSSFKACQGELDGAASRGINAEKIESFLVAYHTEQSRIINPERIQDVTADTVEKNILKPRQDLYLFILYNWIRRIFVPSLDSAIGDNLLIFGIGRIFSAYSDIGVQYCTDADLNFVVHDCLSRSEVSTLALEVGKLKQRIWDLFGIIVEVDVSFTVLTVAEIRSRLAQKDRDARVAATLFYKGNSKSLFVLHDNPDLRTDVFGDVQRLPDALLFDQFLGGNPVKPTFLRLREGLASLSVVADDTQQKEKARFLIGTNEFFHQCRLLSAIHPELYPPSWCFSMKYTVNRVYDYISAMRQAGHALTEIGFSGERDPDYLFIHQSHRLMLLLQELIHVKLDTFNYLCDYAYMCAERFDDLMNMPKSTFRADFDGFVLGPHFLLASERKHYLTLKQAIHEKRPLLLSLTEKQEKDLTKVFGFAFRHLDKGSGKIPVSIPYTWKGLGFFVFNAVANRLSTIIDDKILPAVCAERQNA
jgi:hypothetical protein